MPALGFKLPADDVRLIEYEGTIYKIKLKYESEDAFLPCSRRELNREVEQVLRSLLHKRYFHDKHLQTEHFHVHCHTYNWDALRLVGFARNDTTLEAHPLVFVMKFQPRPVLRVQRDVPLKTGQSEWLEVDTDLIEIHDKSLNRSKPAEIKEKTSLKSTKSFKEKTMENLPQVASCIVENPPPAKVQQETSQEACHEKENVDKSVNSIGSKYFRDTNVGGMGDPRKHPDKTRASEKENGGRCPLEKAKACQDFLRLAQTPPKFLRVNLGKKISEKELLENFNRAAGDSKTNTTSNNVTAKPGMGGDNHRPSTNPLRSPTAPGNVKETVETHCESCVKVNDPLLSGSVLQPSLRLSTVLPPAPTYRRTTLPESDSSTDDGSSQRAVKMKVFRKHRPKKSNNQRSEQRVDGGSSEELKRKKHSKNVNKGSTSPPKMRRRSSSFSEALDSFLDSFL